MKFYTSYIFDDTKLLLQGREDSKGAFNVLYNRYLEQAYSSFYKRLKNAGQAKYFVTNTWLRKERQIDNLPACLNITVRNQVCKLVDKQKKNIFLFYYA